MSKIRIAVTGPESTGKSVLAAKLAKHYDAVLVKEYARTYYSKHPYKNTRDEIISIAEGQIEAEQTALKTTNSVIICDSDLINIKIWLEYYHYSIPKFILDYLAKNPYDLSLLLYPNTPWIADSLRTNPSNRIELYECFKTTLLKYNYSFEIVQELDGARFLEAVQFIKVKLGI